MQGVVASSDRATDPRGWLESKAVGGSGGGSSSGPPAKSTAEQRRLKEAQRRARQRLRDSEREERWNGSVYRNVPDPLRGVKPITREPWAYGELPQQQNKPD